MVSGYYSIQNSNIRRWYKMSYRFVREPRGYRGPQGYDGSIG